LQRRAVSGSDSSGTLGRWLRRWFASLLVFVFVLAEQLVESHEERGTHGGKGTRPTPTVTAL
jgi:hypothetical protein